MDSTHTETLIYNLIKTYICLLCCLFILFAQDKALAAQDAQIHQITTE